MKIAIAGKGGTGKTTIGAFLCHYLSGECRNVIAVDADPASNLGAALGIDTADMVPIAEMEDLIRERTGRKGDFGGYFKMNPQVEDIPKRFSKSINNIRLLVLGTVKRAGGGCMCPESALLRALMAHLLVGTDDAVVMDMEAGVEHLGRATARAVNTMLIVVEPGQRSLAVGLRVRDLALQMGLEKIVAVVNKVHSPAEVEVVKSALGDMATVGEIPYDPELAARELKGEPVVPGAAGLPDYAVDLGEAVLRTCS